MKIIFLIISFSFIFSATAIASEYAVVSNKNIKSLSKAQIKAIFLKKMTVANNIKIIPVNLNARDELRINFEKKILKMSFNKLKSYWTKQHYLGYRPPLSMKSQNSVIAFVKKVDGAIGYIDINNVDDDLKIIYKWSN